MQRSIATIRCHLEGVWTLQADEAFTRVYSAGKDRKVYVTDFRDADRSTLLFEESAPVLKVGAILIFGFFGSSVCYYSTVCVEGC